ncbi:MAG: hypothetical protein V3V97_17985 [Hyphomicrobiaceae bacterium]
MTINFSEVMLSPIYAALGTTTSFVLADTSTIELTVIDKTSGIEIAEGSIDIQTVKPAAVIRMVDLAALSKQPKDLMDAVLDLNGVSWAVKSYFPKPSPNGEADGELYLLLEAS